MGSNREWTTVEKIAVAIYNDGNLNLETLDKLCEIYRGTDIDSGGSMNLQTHDGKSFERIAVELVKPEFSPDEGGSEPWGWYEEFMEISRLRWGWR